MGPHPTNIEFSLQNRENLAPPSSQQGEGGRRKGPQVCRPLGDRAGGDMKAPSALEGTGYCGHWGASEVSVCEGALVSLVGLKALGGHG